VINRLASKMIFLNYAAVVSPRATILSVKRVYISAGDLKAFLTEKIGIKSKIIPSVN
jgi:hypothetical protein